MINESKQAIKQVFDNFDKDKSGFVEIGELAAIAKELNQELKQDELDKLVKVVDVNKDGKISFQEFWDWWQYGKNGKLERLVFMKIKMMNLVKKVHSEFTRQGQSLEQKYLGEGKDNHYFALNYGETFGHLKAKSTIIMNGKGIQDEIAKISKGLPLKELVGLQILCALKCDHPTETKAKLQQWYDDFQKEIDNPDSSLDEEVRMLFGKGQGLALRFHEGQSEILIHILFNHPLVTESLETQYMPYILQLGGNNYVQAEVNLGIKNGLKKLINKNLAFIKYLCEGFIAEASVTINSDLIKNIFNLAMFMVGSMYGQEKSLKSGLKKSAIFPLLLKSSKIHFTFRNMEDVDELFRGLGLSDLVTDQPSGRDLINEIFTENDLEEFKPPGSPGHQFYKLILLFQQNIYAQGSFHIILPYAIANINITLDGMSEFMDVLFRNEADQKEKKVK